MSGIDSEAKKQIILEYCKTEEIINITQKTLDFISEQVENDAFKFKAVILKITAAAKESSIF